MAGGDATLLEHAMSGHTVKLDSVHLLKSVEYIIEHRKNRIHVYTSLKHSVIKIPALF
jgi:hypothetical protein